jgi:hypothetical protein
LLADDLGTQIDKISCEFSAGEGSPLELGWTCDPGEKGDASIKRVNKCVVPYTLKPSRTEAGAQFEVDSLRPALEFMWGELERYFPEAADLATSLPDEYHYLGTGFNKTICEVNASTPLHFGMMGKGNLSMVGTVCAMLVLGDFEGGEQLVVKEGECVVLHSAQGTLFVGDYGRIMHATLPVTKGRRTTICGFTMQSIQKYADRVLRAHEGARPIQRYVDRYSLLIAHSSSATWTGIVY